MPLSILDFVQQVEGVTVDDIPDSTQDSLNSALDAQTNDTSGGGDISNPEGARRVSKNLNGRTGFTSIQDAIDGENQKNGDASDIGAINQGGTIFIEDDTFNESIEINIEGLTLEGAGNSASGTVLEGSSSGNGITVDASDLTVRDLRVTNHSNGIRLINTQSNVVFENVDSVENSARGMEVRNSADFENLVLDNVNFSNNDGDGLRAATTSSIDGLTITDSSFNNNLGEDSSGIEIFQSESDPGLLNDVEIKNTEFIDNGQKGIFTEKLSNATIENVTVDGVNSDTNGFNGGIDINLKYDDYENITIRDTTVANVSKGDPGGPIGDIPSASVAVAIKARGSSSEDTPYANEVPATLDNVIVNNVTIEDSFNGLRIGEFGVDYSDGGGPTNVTITDSTFQNIEGYFVEDVTGNFVEDVTGNLNLSDIRGNNQFNLTPVIDGRQIVSTGVRFDDQSFSGPTSEVTIERARADDTLTGESNEFVLVTHRSSPGDNGIVEFPEGEIGNKIGSSGVLSGTAEGVTVDLTKNLDEGITEVTQTQTLITMLHVADGSDGTNFGSPIKRNGTPVFDQAEITIN